MVLFLFVAAVCGISLLHLLLSLLVGAAVVAIAFVIIVARMLRATDVCLSSVSLWSSSTSTTSATMTTTPMATSVVELVVAFVVAAPVVAVVASVDLEGQSLVDGCAAAVTGVVALVATELVPPLLSWYFCLATPEKARAAKVEDWVVVQRRRLYAWAGHVARRDDGRCSKEVLAWMPPHGHHYGEQGRGKRRGRPNTRWEEPLDKFFNEVCSLEVGDWRLLATNRDEWSSHAKASARHEL